MKYCLVFDSETTNTMDDPICYDNGWLICNELGEIVRKRSFVIADIFIDEPELMKVAYFADKIPQYLADIADGKREIRRYSTIRKILAQDCAEFEVSAIIAHNMRFDYKATAKTQRWLTSSKSRYFFPYGIPLWDSLKMARQTFGKSEEYKQFCRNNGFVTSRNVPKLTAEVLYRYLTNNNDFVESHTGLEDTLIEKEIFLACLAMDSEIECGVWSK